MTRLNLKQGTRLVLALAVLTILLPSPAGASEEAGATLQDREGRIELAETRFSQPVSTQSAASAFWPSRVRQEAYVLFNTPDDDTPVVFNRIARVSLPDGRVIADGSVGDGRTIGGYRSGGTPPESNGAGTTPGASQTVVLDEAGGRIFVAYGHRQSSGGTDTLRPVVNPVSGQACAQRCVGGVLIFDALSLTPLGRIDVRSLGVDGAAPPRAELLAMDYAPPREEGGAGKVIMLVSINLNVVVSGDTACRSACQPENLHAPPQFVVQLDPGRMVMDWAVRLDACRGNRSVGSGEGVVDWPVRLLPWHSGVFRSASVTNPMVVVGCRAGSAWTGTVVQVPLDGKGNPAGVPVVVGEDPAGAIGEGVEARKPPGSGEVVGAAPSPRVITGPDRVVQMIADPTSERLLMRVVDGGAEVWWVYDNKTGAFVGTIGIGAVPEALQRRFVGSMAGFDAVSGRLYVLSPSRPDRNFPGGLFMADVRRTPVPQALHFPEFTDLARIAPGQNGSSSDRSVRPLIVAPEAPQDAEAQWPRRVYVPNSHTTEPSLRAVQFYSVLVDRVTVSVDPLENFAQGRTLDLDEVVGVTEASADGAARGYGARIILVAGIDGAARVGPLDPIGQAYQCNSNEYLIPKGNLGETQGPCFNAGVQWSSPCSEASREVVLGAVGVGGPAVLDGSGGRGTADPVVVDSGLRSDLEAPVSRCSGSDWDGVWSTGLSGRPLVGEPAVGWPGAPRVAECVSGESEGDGVGDPVVGVFAARVACGEDEASGFSYARGQVWGPVSVAEALSSFRVYRDPGRGIVARVESVARGVAVEGVGRIDSVRGTAESWANGRRFTPPVLDDGQVYDANCDFERTAGSCFVRHIFGVVTPGYRCGPCGDEATLVDRLSRGMGANGTVRLRDPDRLLARGAENGFVAAVTKPTSERFADLALNNDLLETVLPTLEIIRYTQPGRTLTGGGPRGRQIVQLAGVEVSTSYGIQCLLVYDEASNTCGAEPVEPGSITVSLADEAGNALAGGAFEVRKDVDADGVLGLVDTLIPDGACVTADDGIGTCTFENLQPGRYLVTQTAAPEGFGKVEDPWVSEVASGEARAVAFTNTSNVSSVAVTVTDETGQPVSGAAFAVFADPDGDGKIAPDTEPAATCTTDSAGVCAMTIPAGSYVLAQTAAPAGLDTIEPVAFTFASGGQTAAVGVVNYPPDRVVAPEPQAGPVYTAPVYSPPVEAVTDYTPPVVDTPRASVSERVGGTVVQIIRAPGDVLRLLSRDPKQAAAWTAALALFAVALLAIRRRQLLGGLTAMPSFAFTGNPPSGPPPTGRPPSSGPSSGPSPSGQRSGGPSGRGPGSPASDTVAAFAPTATALLERPVVAGAAPLPVERVHADVVVATSSPVVAALVTQRLAAAERVTVLAAVASMEELHTVLARYTPDVLLIDLGLPTGRVEDICAIIARLHPAERVVALIGPDLPLETLAGRAVQSGLAGVLAVDGDIGNGHLAYAVRQVASGNPCYGPTVQAALRQTSLLRPASRRGRPRIVELTEREREVAQLVADGVSRIDIAEQLCLSPWTVKRHLQTVRAKLGVINPRDRDELRRRLATTDEQHD